MPNEILTDMTNSFDWYGKMFDWYEKKLTDMKKTVDWYGKNHISQTFLTDMVLTTPDGDLLALPEGHDCQRCGQCLWKRHRIPQLHDSIVESTDSADVDWWPLLGQPSPCRRLISKSAIAPIVAYDWQRTLCSWRYSKIRSRVGTSTLRSRPWAVNSWDRPSWRKYWMPPRVF